ncbi:MAG: DUF4249 domain-containing protein, partial [Tannerella sp.]|nr:DUF4249 domain-containing protein [Tannerella sp.]
AFTVFEDDTVMQSNDLYASNVLIDKMNRSNGTEVKDEDIGSAYYEGFIRVKNHNIPHIDSLLFITHISSIHYFADGELHQKKRKSFLVKTITAGPEYDRYMRTFYQQTANVVYDDDISAIVYQPVQVYSNINGGLGIFAGINAVNYYFDIPAKE